MKQKELRVYNLLFPVWMLIWWPSVLWLGLIPFNYALDALVLHHSLPAAMDRRAFRRHHAWKICLAGFAGDFLGSALLFAVYALSSSRKLTYDIAYQPLASPGALAVTLAAVVLAGAAIFALDRWILCRAGLGAPEALRAARNLALLTAPYLFFFPSGLLYR